MVMANLSFSQRTAVFGFIVCVWAAVYVEGHPITGEPRRTSATGGNLSMQMMPQAAGLTHMDCSLNLVTTCENGTSNLETARNITEDQKALGLEDCEGGLFNKSGQLLSDAPPFGKARMSDLIKQVTLWNLTIASCPSEIYWKISCNKPRYEFLTCYRIIEETSSKPSSQRVSNYRDRWLLLAPLLFVAAVVVMRGTLTWRKPTQTQGGHVNSRPQDPGLPNQECNPDLPFATVGD